MTRSRIPRTPLGDIRKAGDLRTGRAVIVHAVSRDGIWDYEREEDIGTLWVVTHVPTGRWMYASSLPKARAVTASGDALRYLDAKDADKARDAQR